MRALLITTVVGVHVAVIGGALLIQGCGTTRGPVSLPVERPMPPAYAEEDMVRPEPVAEPYRRRVPPPAVAPAPVADSPEQDMSTYVVGKGDSLSVIAKRFGVSLADLLALNNISNPDLIRLGQELRLPGEVDVSAPAAPTSRKPKPVPEGASRYVVQSGDSLSVIAYRAGISVQALREANGISGDRILVGQELVIPGGREIKPSPAPSSTPAPTSSVETTPEPILAPEPQMRSLPPEQPRRGTARNTYTVEIGDDILTVASKHNVSIAELRRANNLSSDILVPGRTLIIPSAD